METTSISPIKQIRTALGITQEDMAARLGCSYASARRFEKEGTLPTNKAVMANLQKLAEEANVSLSK